MYFRFKTGDFFKNRPQRYYFLRTQPNIMHKNRQYVHNLAVLCKEYGVL